MSNPNTTNRSRTRPWLDERGNLLRRLPAECIEVCGGPGEVSAPVRQWANRLRFANRFPVAVAREWLEQMGAWDRAELAEWDTDRIARTCLWLMACDAREMRAQGEPFAQPFGIVS